MRRLITVAIALLTMALSARAQDQFNVNTNPAPASCTTTYDGAMEKLRAQDAQAQGQFRKDNLDCQSESDSTARAACGDAATTKYRAVQLGVHKGQTDADANRQICDNHKRLAEARAFNAKNKPDPCQDRHDQTMSGLSDQEVLAEAQFRKDNLDCQFRSDSTACDAATKKYRAVQLEVGEGQTDADTNRTICWDRKRLAKSEAQSPSSGEPPALPEVPNGAPTASTGLSGGVAENGPLPGANASTINNSPPSGEPLKGLKAEVPTLAPVSGPAPRKPLQGAISKNVVGNSAHPIPQTPASANIAKNPIQGHVAAKSANSGSEITGRAGSPDGTREFDPRRPEMGALVPKDFSPNRLPEGIYVAKGLDGRGYAMPIEGCIPDTGTDLALANLGALALRAALRACSTAVGIGAGVPPPPIPHVPPQDEMVWVNTARGIIWRQGTKWAGSTSKGFWTNLNDALANGYRLPKPNPTGLPW